MKIFFISVILLMLLDQTFGQNVGIGTNTPHASAILHINGNNKGVLFPTVYLQNQTDNSTITNAPFGLMVMNSNGTMSNGRGLYFNAATNGFPALWEPVGVLRLPYQGTTSTEQYAFQVNNNTANTVAVGILGYASVGRGIYGSSNSGTGVYATSNSGLALQVAGKIKISGLSQTPGQGKVLTSDASGNATWEGAIAFSSSGIQNDGARYFEDGVEKKVPFFTEDYDLGNNYNPSTVSPYSTFTAPVKGIYLFNVQVMWANATSTWDGAGLRLKTTYNGVTKTRVYVFSEFGVHHLAQDIHQELLLEAGEQVFVTARQSSGSTVAMDSYYAPEVTCYFSGRLMTKL